MLPKTVIYDPELMLGLPPAVSAASGMNAIAHCVEALYARDANPITSLMAEEGIRALATALPILVRETQNLEARSEALYGAWLAGVALGSTGVALHHKLCHTLGGSFNLPHAQTHAIVLPHAARYNRDAAPEAMAAADTLADEAGIATEGGCITSADLLFRSFQARAGLGDGDPTPLGRLFPHDVPIVALLDGRIIGKVDEILSTAANDIFVVHGEGKEVLVPVIDAVVKAMAFDARRITIDPVPGLLD